MSTWKKVKLGDLVELKRGYDLPQKNRVEGKYPIVSSSGITGSHNASKAKAPGVVTGRYGTLGQVFYMEEDFWPLNTSLYVKDFKGNDPRFISYLLTQLSLGSRDAAGAVPGVNRNHLHTIEIHSPDIKTQIKIGETIALYDQQISINDKKLRLLEKILSSSYEEWFLERVKKETPLGWKLENILSLEEFSLCSERVRGFKGERKYFDTSSINGIEIVKEPQLVSEDNIPSRAQMLPVKNSVWFARMSNSFKVVAFGQNADDEVYSSILSSGMMGIKTSEKYFAFLFSTILSTNFHNLKDKFATGATQVSLTNEGFSNIKVVIPTIDVMERYSTSFNPVVEEILLIQKKSEKLKKIKELLVPKFIKGEIEIKA